MLPCPEDLHLRAEAILRVLEGHRRAWPEPLALNVRARSPSELETALGWPRSAVREALVYLDRSAVIERAPRFRSHEGGSEATWAARDPATLRNEQRRRWRMGFAVRSRHPGRLPSA